MYVQELGAEQGYSSRECPYERMWKTRDKKTGKGREDDTVKYPGAERSNNKQQRYRIFTIVRDLSTIIKSLDTYARDGQILSTLACMITVDAQLRIQHIRAPFDFHFQRHETSEEYSSWF